VSCPDRNERYFAWFHRREFKVLSSGAAQEYAEDLDERLDDLRRREQSARFLERRSYRPTTERRCPMSTTQKKNRDTLDRTHRQATCRDAELTICLLDLMESLEDSRTLTHAEIMTYVMATIRPSIPPRSSTPSRACATPPTDPPRSSG
jgi:hypothetical protein